LDKLLGRRRHQTHEGQSENKKAPIAMPHTPGPDMLQRRPLAEVARLLHVHPFTLVYHLARERVLAADGLVNEEDARMVLAGEQFVGEPLSTTETLPTLPEPESSLPQDQLTEKEVETTEAEDWNQQLREWLAANLPADERGYLGRYLSLVETLLMLLRGLLRKFDCETVQGEFWPGVQLDTIIKNADVWVWASEFSDFFDNFGIPETLTPRPASVRRLLRDVGDERREDAEQLLQELKKMGVVHISGREPRLHAIIDTTYLDDVLDMIYGELPPHWTGMLTRVVHPELTAPEGEE